MREHCDAKYLQVSMQSERAMVVKRHINTGTHSAIAIVTRATT